MPEHAMRERQPARRSLAAPATGSSGPLSKAPTVQRLAEQKRALDARGASGGLPPQLKAGIEALSGLSMDDVRVHRNSSRPAALQAHAFAQGNDIHLAPGQDHHLPHEAWHVVQQKQGRVRATLQLAAGVPVNDDAGLEREADVMGARALKTVDPSASALQRQSPPSQAPAQRSTITDALEEADAAWGSVTDYMDEIDARYPRYADVIRSFDGHHFESKGIAAAHGLKFWSENYRNKSLAYLTEVEKAITKTGGYRLAILGSNLATEPDLFIYRGDDAFSEEVHDFFGIKDHIEFKRTEGGSDYIKARTRDATMQLLNRKDDNVRNYIAECFAPLWYPNLIDWGNMSLWANEWVTANAKKFATNQISRFGNFIVRIYYAKSSTPITAKKSIPHG